MQAELCRQLAQARSSPYYKYFQVAEDLEQTLLDECLSSNDVDNLSSDTQTFLNKCLLSESIFKELYPNINSSEFLTDEQITVIVSKTENDYK
ncbi:hypothetical protein LC593_10630 [Nostoc sp. CHAB 5844]|nr:hypothetical protein [Nostoc sp. CHAB 5844]